MNQLWQNRSTEIYCHASFVHLMIYLLSYDIFANLCQRLIINPYIQIGSGNNIFYVIEGHQHTTENRGGGKDVVGIRGG